MLPSKKLYRMFFVPFLILFFFFLSPSYIIAAEGDIVTKWVEPVKDRDYAFEEDVVVTGNFMMPPLWVGNVYVKQDGFEVPDKEHSGADCAQRPAPAGCYIQLPVNTDPDNAIVGTFSYNIGQQSDGVHSMTIEFWGGEICSVKQQVNLAAEKSGLVPPYADSETCATTETNFYSAQLYLVRDYTVNRPNNPRFVVSPSTDPAFTLTNILTGSINTKIFYLSNTGLRSLNYTVSELPAPFYCTANCSGTLAPGQTDFPVTIKIAPTTNGTLTQTVTFNCSANFPYVCDNPTVLRKIQMSSVGEDVLPKVSITQGNPINFGSGYLGNPSTFGPQVLKVKNSGGGLLEGAVVLPGGGEYSCAGGVSGCSYSLLGGEEKSINLYFTPLYASTTRVDRATLTALVGATSTTQLRSSISDLPILGVCLNQTNACWSSWNAGTVNVGATSSINVYVRNNGASVSDLSGRMLGLPRNGFSFEPSSVSGIGHHYASVTPSLGYRYIGRILFSPLASGATSTVASLTNEFPDGLPSVNISLSANGNDLPLLVAAGGTTINFGNVLLNTTATTSYQIRNNGVGTTTVSLSTLSFGTGNAFSCAQNCSFDLGGGQSTTTLFTFNPTSLGLHTGSFTIAGTTVTFRGTGINPGVSISAMDAMSMWYSLPTPGVYSGTIDYGTTFYNTPVQNSSLGLRITRSGSSGTSVWYHVTSSTSTFRCTDFCGPFTLSDLYSERTAQIAFEPNYAGDFAGEITVQYHFGDYATKTTRYNVKGSSIASSYIQVTPVNHAFGNTVVGGLAPEKSFEVKNIGLIATEVSLGAYTNSAIFTCVNPSPCSVSSLAPNATTSFTFAFYPSETGSVSASIPFVGADNIVTRSISGYGINSPIMKLTPVTINDPDTYTDIYNFIDFGLSNLASSKDQYVRLWNVGVGDMSIGVTFPNAGDTYSCQPAATGCAFTVPQDSYRDVRLQFLPMDTGSIDGTVRFSGVNTINGPLEMTLSGEGEFTSIITILGSGQIFPATVVNRYREQALTIKNTGTADFGTGIINIDSVSGMFTCVSSSAGPLVGGKCPYELDSDGSTTIVVRFAPTTVGKFGGTVSLSGLSFVNFSLSGTGVPPSVQYIER